MRCANPLVMYVNGDLHSFGCGHCLACKIQRSREWSFRLSVEASYWKDACFLTLTYNNENLPNDNSLHKEDLQKFIKRLRKDFGKPIKYFACGEYGDRFKRPHYHAIIFGLPVRSKKLVQNNWRYGFSYLGSVSSDSINYVTSYVQKKLYGKGKYSNVEAPFSLMSKGLGLRYCLDNKAVLSEADCLVYRGKKISVPRYFVKKLGLSKYNSYIRLCPIADKLGYDSKYIIGHNPYLLSACIYNDKRVLGSLHQVNLRLNGAFRSKVK